MSRIISFFTILLFLIITCSCEKTYAPNGGDIVINELMPVNSTTVTDQNGQYDDWIELFNFTASTIDLSGYFLSDNKKELTKWQFPQGASISGNGYLIIWADNDTTQTGLHTNFKLSSAGEEVLLSKPNSSVIDKIDFPAQSLEFSYSRNPNGTGGFKWQIPTFNKSNGSK